MDWEIRIFSETVDVPTIVQMAEVTFGDYVKGVIDVEQKTPGLGGELNADIEELLLAQGSVQQNLWGINLYPHESWRKW